MMRKMRMMKIIGGLVAAVVLVGACGGGNGVAPGAGTDTPTAVDGGAPIAGESTDESRKPKPPPKADLAPDFTVTTFEGERFRLSELRGTPVVLTFWESW
jgi:cytochrome oxidase Cu insertion factor (SCO1/SenC/PrrC family)